MATTSPDHDHTSPATRTGIRSGTIGIVLLVLLVAAGIGAYVILTSDDSSDGATSTLVVLDGDEMRHIDGDGEMAASFDLGLDTDELSSRIVVGSHIVATLDDELIVIDAAEGEVRRFDLPDDGIQVGPTGILGQSGLVGVGSPAGGPQLDVIDLETGARHEMGAGSDDAMYVAQGLLASPDGTRVAATNLRSDPESPTMVLSLEDDEAIELPGYLAGLTDDRAITSEFKRDEETALVRWFDTAGEVTWETSIDPPDSAMVMPDGALIAIIEGEFVRVSEGDEDHEELDGPDLEPGAARGLVPVGTAGRMLLFTDSEVMLLDADAQTLATAATPRARSFAVNQSGRRCVTYGAIGTEAAVFDVESGEALVDGTEVVAAQSAADGCTLVIGDAEGREAQVVGADIDGDTTIEIGEGELVTGVTDDGRHVTLRSRDGVFLVPSDGEGDRIEIASEPVWHQFIALGG